MKLSDHFATCLVLSLLAFGLTGCQTHKTTTSMSNGYEEVSHPYRAFIDEPPPPRVSFQHRSADKTVTEIWPALYGANEVFRGDLAIFVGNKAYVSPERELNARLFAVRSPALPLDITDEILRRWSQAAGKDFSKARDRFVAAVPAEDNGCLRVELQFWANNAIGSSRDDWPERGAVRIDWPQVEEIMRLGKSHGIEVKDLQWNTSYITEKF